ncbi:hypothetical protein J6590_002357 [Homalodisca vitripennis]|nr:hypothetical protein J6590_002357 [Homalodisca vitripennis]
MPSGTHPVATRLRPAEPKGRVFCSDCGRSYSRPSHLRRHRQFDCGSVSRQFACTICTKRFKHKHHLNDHVTYVHLYPRQARKRLCLDSLLEQVDDFDAYNRVSLYLLTCYCVPARTKDYVCPHCSRAYYNKTTLTRHLRFECSVIGPEPQFRCPHCDKRCKLKAHLQSHILHRHMPSQIRLQQ